MRLVGATGPGAGGRRDLAPLRELCHPRHQALAGRRVGRPTIRRASVQVRRTTVLPGDDTVGVKDPGGEERRRPVAHLAVLSSARPPRRHRPDVHPLRDQHRRPGTGTCTTWRWPDGRVRGISGAPGWPRWCTGRAGGWPTTTAGPTRRRTPRSGPASPPGDEPGQLVAEDGLCGCLARRPGIAALRVAGSAARRRRPPLLRDQPAGRGPRLADRVRAALAVGAPGLEVPPGLLLDRAMSSSK